MTKTLVTDDVLAQVITGHLLGSNREIRDMAQEIRDRRDAENMKNPPDLVNAGIVEIESDVTGKLWVNVDGTCRLRIGNAVKVVLRFPEIVIDPDSKIGTVKFTH